MIPFPFKIIENSFPALISVILLFSKSGAIGVSKLSVLTPIPNWPL
jgi:hypothetical protein